ncbi:unnamed protein product, partial [Effrenium voratum]
ALGLSFSWTAEITSQQPAKLISRFGAPEARGADNTAVFLTWLFSEFNNLSWESTSGLKNAGAAIFERLPHGNSSACRVS